MTVKWNKTVDSLGKTTQEFRLLRKSKRDVTGALWLPHSKIKDTLIVFGHGASGNRYQAPICSLANRFNKNGYASISIDGPVHGLREIPPGGREAFAQELRSPTVIEDMIEDWDIAIKLSADKTKLANKTIAYFGLSMGSIFGIPLLSSFARDSNKVVVATLGLLGTTGAVKFLGNRFKTDASLITSPTLFLMQLEDELFPRHGCLELFDSIGSSNKTLHANPGLHPEVPTIEIDYAFQFMLGHIEGHLTNPKNTPIAQ